MACHRLIDAYIMQMIIYWRRIHNRHRFFISLMITNFAGDISLCLRRHLHKRNALTIVNDIYSTPI